MVVDILFIGAQSTEMVVSFRDCSGMTAEDLTHWKDVIITVKSTAGAADVARIVTYKACKDKISWGDVLAVVNRIAFRTADLEQAYAQGTPDLYILGMKQKNIMAVCDVAEFAGMVLGSEAVQCKGAAARDALAYWLWENKKVEDQNLTSGNNTPQSEHTRIAITASQLADVEEVCVVDNIESLDHIPNIFANSPLLKWWKCAITGKPIRYIRVVKGTSKTAHPIYYEKAVIEQRIAENPREHPPGWPKDIPFLLENLKASMPDQYKIDENLKILLDEAKIYYPLLLTDLQ